ncbi:helix-turn-helix domain-containing protein, partial [Acinetobacter baumannii]
MDKDSYRLQEFGIRLAELRKKNGISQEKLALESGLARSYLSGVESCLLYTSDAADD